MKLAPKVFTIASDGPGEATPRVEERIARKFGHETTADMLKKSNPHPVDWLDMVRNEAERVRLEAVQSRLESCGDGWPIRLLRKLHHYGLVGQEQPPVWALELIVSEIEAELDKPVR